MEKIITNVDILYEIFSKYFNFEDQIQLANVCKQFRSVILDFVWQNKFVWDELEITPHFDGRNYILSSSIINRNSYTEYSTIKVDFKNTRHEKVAIKSKDLKTFLELIASDVKELCLKKAFNYNLEFEFRIENKWPNLVSITYRHVLLTEDDIKVLSSNCPKLERLVLDYCQVRTKYRDKSLVIGDDITMETLRNISGLRCLEIDQTHTGGIADILTKLNVKQLEIRVPSLYENRCDDKKFADCIKLAEDETIISSHPCEVLYFGSFSTQSAFKTFNTTLLNNFQNLHKLTLKSNRGIKLNVIFFNSLSKICSQLKYLNLKEFIVTGFSSLYTLDELVFHYCVGFKWTDFKLMLNDMNLKSFTLIYPRKIASENFDYFNIASTVEYLKIVYYPGNEFKDLLEMYDGQNMRNLSTLIYYYNTEDLWDNTLDIPKNIATNFSTKLKTLTTLPCKILINNIDCLKSLENLTLKLYRSIKFSEIIKILKHPNLSELTIRHIGEENMWGINELINDCDISKAALLDLEDFKTNLVSLNVLLERVVHVKLDFWFNLLRNNSKLSILFRIKSSYLAADFFHNIINNENFPKRIKSIKIDGYNFEIKEFWNNFDETVAKALDILKQQSDYEHYMLLSGTGSSCT